MKYFHVLTLTNTTKARNSEIKPNKYKVVRICTSGNFAQKWIITVYNYKIIVAASLTT
jgi:hypothetical protein